MEYQVRNLTALGLLVLVAGGLFVWGFFFLLGDPILTGGTEVTVVMTDGAGLNRGDRVQLNGVQIGSVKRVTLHQAEGVTMDIRVNAGLRLPADTRAVARSDVFGAATVDLIPGRALVMLESGDTIRGSTVQPLPDLASEIGGQARTVLAAADSLLSPRAVSDLRATATVLPEVAAQMRAAFAELALAAAALRRTAEEMERAGAGGAMADAMAEFGTTARATTNAMLSLDGSVQSLTSVLAKIDEGHGTIGRLVNDTTLYGELFATLRQVRELTADIQTNPRRFINFSLF